MIRSKHIFGMWGMIIPLFLLITFLTNCKSNVSKGEFISVQISQATWNMDNSNGSGNIDVYLEGAGVENIVLNSIQMRGDNSSAQPLSPVSAVLEGARVHVVFAKNGVMAILNNPSNGTTHVVTISFYVTGQGDPVSVTSQVTITSGGGDDGGSSTSVFQLEIDPLEWSLNFDKSSGTVEAFIRGDDIEDIDLNSFTIKGDNTAAEPVAAENASRNNNHIHARFAKNTLIALLLNPEPGSTHTVTVSFLNSETGQTVELTADIAIEDDDDNTGIVITELSLEIDPDEWSMNYGKSNGTVEAFIEGEGIENIDLSSIEMMGDNTAATPLAAVSASINGDHVHARFAKNQLLELLLNPEEGSTHTITISFIDSETGERLELTAVISIEEDDDDDGEDPEPTDLSLEIVPPTWNLNYDKASGQIKAFIRGDGLEDIDLDSFKLAGDNPGAEELEADSASLQGNHIQAKFPKNQVLGLLNEPSSGSVHTVTVTFSSKSGEEFELTAEVSITGKD